MRQTRLLAGEYVVTRQDVRDRVHFHDSVCRGRDYYTPYRALLPVGVDQLLVAGRRRTRRRRLPGTVRPGETATQPGHEPGERGCPASSDPGAVDARPLPLAGVRVLDFTQVMMGPCCTQMLGDYGADVIKIERAGSGDLSRWSVGEDPDGGNNPVFASLNRNKRSIALNLKSDGTGPRRCVSWRPQTWSSTTSAPASWSAWVSATTTCAASIRASSTRSAPASALEGPYVHKGGQDVLAQAMSGAMHRRADPELPLSIYPTTLADYSAGMHLMQGILLALLQREKTGEGQQVAVSLYNSMLAMQMQEAAVWMMRGRELNWAAMPLSGVFETTDGAIVMVGAFKENPLRDICGALGIEDLSADARYATLEQQKAHRSELQTIFPRPLRRRHHRALAGTARRRRHPVRASEDAEGCP